MKALRYLAALLSPLAFLSAPAHATDAVGAQTVSACGTPNNTPVVGNPYALTMDTAGKLCVNAAVTASVVGTTSNASSGVATSSTNLATVAYNYGFNGTTWDQLQVDGSKNLKIDINAGSIANTSFGATQAAAANLNATVVGTGTFVVQDSPTATATGGATAASIVSANSTNATVVKNGAGTLYHISVQSSSTTAFGYLIFFNTGTTPTCTGTPFYGPVLIPFVGSTGNGGSGVIEDFAVGLNFSTGISYCITTAPGGTGSVAASAITGGLGYK